MVILKNKIFDLLCSEECESFSIAFLFHSIVLFVLAMIFCVSQNSILNTPIIISTEVETELKTEISDLLPIEEINIRDITSLTKIENNYLQEDSSLKTETINAPILNADANLLKEPDLIPNGGEFFFKHFSGALNNRGSGVSQHSSTDQALDRLTLEIIKNAETKDLTVVWLFDASISLNFQRKQIYDRFDKIIDELKFLDHTKQINHCICSFGSEINFITKIPTDDCHTLKKDIESISTDSSGIENTFSSIAQVCKKYAKPKHRLMVVVFTDEVGDDQSLLNEVAHLVRLKGSMIYAVGSPAPFGKSFAQFKFVEFDPRYQDSEKWVEIQQGPETPYDMTLNINSLSIDKESLDSGFGPFSLSKLCADSGGLFFSIHPNRNNKKNEMKDINPLSSYISRFFDSTIMEQYKPDYELLDIKQKSNHESIIKECLIRACSIPLDISGEQKLIFNAFDEPTFIQELNSAQRFSAKIEPKINEIYNILLVGEPHHKILKNKRWIASYYLAMGRILYTKCRIESYNLILAEAKAGLKKQDPKNNIWILIPSKDFNSTNSLLKKNYETAKKYLSYIIENFPDTPWALIASEELNTSIGYTWNESYKEPPQNNNGNGINNIPPDDKIRPKLIPKPLRKIDKI